LALALQRLTARCLVVALLLCAGLGEAHGQNPEAAAQSAAAPAGEPAAIPEPLTREALRDLPARLSDAQVRELLIAQLDKEIAAAPAAGSDGYVDKLEAEATNLRQAWGRMLAAVPDLPTVPLFLARQLIGDRNPSILLAILVGIGAIFLAGAAPSGCNIA
jgi:hypothetical protein